MNENWTEQVVSGISQGDQNTIQIIRRGLREPALSLSRQIMEAYAHSQRKKRRKKKSH